MANVKVNDISMYYEIHGKGEPIVFISGFGSDHTVWSGVIEYFTPNYQVILFDNRGAGQTDVPMTEYSIQEMANDIIALCSTLGIDRAHFVGNSMGGFILQLLAAHNPSLVKSATISHSAPTIDTPFNIYLAAQLELLKAGAPKSSIIKASYSWVFSFKFLSQPGMLDYLVQMTLDNPYPFTIPGYEGQFSALDKFDSRSWIKQINVPTLVLASDQDLIFSEKIVKNLAEQIPGANYYCFSGCGHLPQIECPKKFAEKVREFISTTMAP